MAHHRFRSLPHPVRAAAALVIGTAGILLVPTAPAAAAATSTLYAAPTGSGTACTSSAPCSLAGAQPAVESIDSAMTGDIVVELAGGTYRMSSAWTFTGSDSATNGYSIDWEIDWEAESGQTPVVSGGVALTSWTEVNSADDIWAATLPSGVSTRDLWINGTRVPLAQDGALPSGTTQSSTGYAVPGNVLQSLADPSDLQFVFNPGNWVQDECGVASISGNFSSTTITMDEPCYETASASGYISLGLPAYIENSASFLSEPNQSSFDGATRTVELIPPSGVNPNDADVEGRSPDRTRPRTSACSPRRSTRARWARPASPASPSPGSGTDPRNSADHDAGPVRRRGAHRRPAAGRAGPACQGSV